MPVPSEANDHTPAYRRIEEDLRRKVMDGVLKPGTMLASRHRIAADYGVALSTAQQAIGILIADGILESRNRQGTYVANRGAGGGIKTTNIGIIATTGIGGNAALDVGTLWTRLAIRAVEHACSTRTAITHFIDRYNPDLGPFDLGFEDHNALTIAGAVGALSKVSIDGLVVVALCDARDLSADVMEAVDTTRVPTAYMSWHSVPPPLSQVSYDNRFSGYQAADHLILAGYEHIVFLAPFAADWLVERVSGARDAVAHAGGGRILHVFPSEPTSGMYVHRNTAEDTHRAAMLAFEQFDIFSGGDWAIIAPNDYTAFAVMNAARAQGKTAGVDYGLVGFDDDPNAATAGLTSVRPPVEAMGESAANIVLRRYAGAPPAPPAILRSTIIPRVSSLRRRR